MAGKLLTRTLVGVLYIAIFLASLLHPFAFMAAMVFVMTVMHVEYYNMAIGCGGYCVEKALATATSLALFLAVFAWKLWAFDSRWLLLCLLPFFATCAALVFDRKERGEVRKTENILFPILYVGLSSALGSLLLFDKTGAFDGRLFLSVFILIWMSDIGAYVLGMGFGQKPDSRKLCPDISPHKSWIGVWGGLLFVCIAAVVLKFVGWLDMGWGHVAALAVLVLVCGILGDLFESLIKRHCGVKDSGRIMPGHGGLLDRFDSALAVLPVVAVYLILFEII
jgi:phosphatidate cytidylyltransferase